MAGLKFLAIVPDEADADTIVRLANTGDPHDRELALGLLNAMNNLQDALDAAVMAGLIVEPSFSRVANRFNDRGCDVDTYVAKVQIFRRLA